MKIYYSIQFFIASVIQLLIILLGEILTVTNLKIDFSLFHILVFLFMGQVCGYLLLWVYRHLKLDKIAIFIIIIIFTLINWGLFTSINFMLKKISHPMSAGFLSILIPFIAFLIYGTYITMIIRNKEVVK